MNTINFKKNKESIRFFIIIFFFVGGYAFFFSSMYWMPASVDASYLTKVGIENTWNNRHITITRWDYSEEQGVMEVELSVETNLMMEKIHMISVQLICEEENLR